MTSSKSPTAAKRKADQSVSAPPLKRKAQSAISKNAVATFFKPASQKPKDRTQWTERAPKDGSPATLLVGRYTPEKEEDDGIKRNKVAAFDMDSTLITTASGKRHADAADDWKWWHSSVPKKLQELHADGYRVIIISNQGGLTLHPNPSAKAPKKNTGDRVQAFKSKCSAIMSNLDIPTTVYAATGKDIFRKPRTGMWDQLLADYKIAPIEVDMENSFFIGDAGGRVAVAKATKKDSIPKDFSCSDRNFAHNVGVKFQTPEEYFLGEKPREFVRDLDLSEYPCPEEADAIAAFEKSEDKEIVIFCGPPGAGKSTFYWKYLKDLGYERVNQDILKSKEKCLKVATGHLEEGDSVVVDNTNASPDTRALWVDLAKKHGVSIRCLWFKTPLIVCEHNDAVRALNNKMNPESREILPKLAFNGFKSRFKEPSVKEGFKEVVSVDFKFRGSEEDYAVWAKYWI